MTRLLKIKKVVIFGVGLLGGSFALALRHAYLKYYFINVLSNLFQKLNPTQEIKTLSDLLASYGSLYQLFDLSDDFEEQFRLLDILKQAIQDVTSFNQAVKQHQSLSKLEVLSDDLSALLAKCVENLTTDFNAIDCDTLISAQEDFNIYYNKFYESFLDFTETLDINELQIVDLNQEFLEIIGVGRSRDNLLQAIHLGIIDDFSTNPIQAIQNADLILFATPVGQIETILNLIKTHINSKTLIIDVGSTKQNVVDAIYKSLDSQQISKFIPCHPIAGGDKSGAISAVENLFVKRNTIITPLAENQPQDIDFIENLWKRCGSNVHLMSPKLHDEIFSAVSHVPHILAFSFMNAILQRENHAELLNFAGTGFRDFTRIASSNAEMWKDICLANQTAILQDIDLYQKNLEILKHLIQTQDENNLLNYLNQASEARQKLLF